MFLHNPRILQRTPDGHDTRLNRLTASTLKPPPHKRQAWQVGNGQPAPRQPGPRNLVAPGQGITDRRTGCSYQGRSNPCNCLVLQGEYQAEPKDSAARLVGCIAGCRSLWRLVASGRTPLFSLLASRQLSLWCFSLQRYATYTRLPMETWQGQKGRQGTRQMCGEHTLDVSNIHGKLPPFAHLLARNQHCFYPRASSINGYDSYALDASEAGLAI